MYWVHGANGSGKTTLMKMVAGMIPFEGNIEIMGISLKAKAVEYRRLVNYVEAEPLYPPFLTGQDLIHFLRTTRNATRDDVDRLTLKFGVEPFINNPIHTYSSGMVKKLSLVLAFIGQPRLILLDEPLVTLDRETVPVLYTLISEYFTLGTSFILASHQLLEENHLPLTRELVVKDRQLCFL